MGLQKAPDEILARIAEIEAADWLGFERSDLIEYLPFAQAKPFLKEGVTSEDWQPQSQSPIEKIKEYMSFAWDKANGNRGISAGRSISHMRAWLWLAGEDDFLAKVGNLDDYEYYGKPQLRAICEHLDIDWQQYDDGRWTNDEMSDGVGPDDVPALVPAD